MNFKALGNSSVQIPEIGIGTWQYTGGPEPLRRAVASGATLIDTAELYGTEEAVGAAIKGIRSRVFLATKVRPANFRRKDLIRSAEASLDRLGTDYIDLYQLHWPNMLVPIEETMGALEQLLENGKIRFIGVSNFSIIEMKHAQAALGRHRIVSNQVSYSLFNRTIEGNVLEYCQQHDVTVIAYSPLGRGLDKIGDHNRSVLDQVAAREGRTQAQVALNWCIQKDGVIAIPKSNTVEHVEENCASSGWSLSEEAIQILEREIQFRRRSGPERILRRLGRRVFQQLGKAM